MDIAQMMRDLLAGGSAAPQPAMPAPPPSPVGSSPAGAGAGPATPIAPPAAAGPPAPPDLGTLYSKLLDQQRSDKYIDGGAALVAAGFAQPANRAGLISGAFGSGGSGGGSSPGSTLTSLQRSWSAMPSTCDLGCASSCCRQAEPRRWPLLRR